MKAFSTAFYESLGARIKSRREEINLRQSDLAELVGLSRTSVTNIERGRQRLFLDQYADICQALRVSPSDIIPKPSQAGQRFAAGDSLENAPPSVKSFLAAIDLGEGRHQ